MKRKEDPLRDKTVFGVSEKYIDALYYNEMFYSAAYWNIAAAVDREMKKLNSKSSNLLDLMENIRMEVIVLGWEDLNTHWSKNVKALTPEELV